MPVFCQLFCVDRTLLSKLMLQLNATREFEIALLCYWFPFISTLPEVDQSHTIHNTGRALPIAHLSDCRLWEQLPNITICLLNQPNLAILLWFMNTTIEYQRWIRLNSTNTALYYVIAYICSMLSVLRKQLFNWSRFCCN